MIYHSVPKEIAEANEERGVFRFTNFYGATITGWIPISKEWVDKQINSAKSTAPAHNDFLGEELAVGDYVLVMERSAWLIARVLAFTESRVKVLVYSDADNASAGPRSILKRPAGVAKIQPTILSD